MAHASIVLDASAAMALVLAEDQGEEVAELIRDTIAINGQIFVPELLWYELGNGLTCYDASNLELALHFQAPLKSFDTHIQILKPSFPLIL